MRHSMMTTGYAPLAGPRPRQLEMRWVPVTEESGRTHMEAVWVDLGAAGAATKPAA